MGSGSFSQDVVCYKLHIIITTFIVYFWRASVLNHLFWQDEVAITSIAIKWCACPVGMRVLTNQVEQGMFVYGRLLSTDCWFIKSLGKAARRSTSFSFILLPRVIWTVNICESCHEVYLDCRDNCLASTLARDSQVRHQISLFDKHLAAKCKNLVSSQLMHLHLPTSFTTLTRRWLLPLWD